LDRIATLYKQLPQTKKLQPAQSKVIRETEAEAAREAQSPPTSPTMHSRKPSVPSASVPQSRPVLPGSTSSGTSSFFRSSKDKKNKPKPFNLEREKPQLLETIASASVASTNLINAIRLINRENQRVSENTECRNRFEQCKTLRRKVLRYIQLVESEQFIGSLLSANDELVKALMAYEVMDKSIEDDSDSDVEVSKARRLSGARSTEDQLAGLSIDQVASSPPKPPRPMGLAIPPVPQTLGKQKVEESDSEPEEEEDDDNPFADRNAVKTPHIEKGGMAW
jgi:hypothetical protein